MKLSKQQKTGLAVLMIALVALVVDRAFLGGGSVPAEASAAPGQTPEKHTPQALDPPDAASPPSTIRLAQRLETLWAQKSLDISQARDVFTLPASWLADVLPAEPVELPQPKKDAVTVFMTSHQLQAVVISDQTRCVTVNDHILRLGDELGGFKLVAIEKDSATFEVDTKRAILRLVSDR